MSKTTPHNNYKQILNQLKIKKYIKTFFLFLFHERNSLSTQLGCVFGSLQKITPNCVIYIYIYIITFAASVSPNSIVIKKLDTMTIYFLYLTSSNMWIGHCALRAGPRQKGPTNPCQVLYALSNGKWKQKVQALPM